MNCYFTHVLLIDKLFFLSSLVSSVAVLPPKRIPKRSHRVVMYDDFSSSSISSANWDYEISMYGGMVRS